MKECKRIVSWLWPLVVLFLTAAVHAQENSDCLVCHGTKGLTTKRGGRTISLYVDEKSFGASVHGVLTCVNCHSTLEGKELPHDSPLPKVECGSCHSDEQKQHNSSLHGKAIARGDPLAPRCQTCHGNHNIAPVKDPRSAVAALRIPFLCGRCPQEGDCRLLDARDAPRSAEIPVALLDVLGDDRALGRDVQRRRASYFVVDPASHPNATQERTGSD
jgi:hypothetical protein